MLRHIWSFVVTFARQWGALVSGGVIVAAIAVYEHLNGRSIYGWPLWIAIIASLFAAFFLAWRKERLRVESLSTNLLPISLGELMGAFEGRTTTQGKKIAAGYIGKWIEVSGPVADVHIRTSFQDMFFSAQSFMSMHKKAPSVAMIMYFGRKWIGTLSALRPGENVTVFGRVMNVEQYSISMDKCEIRKVSQKAPEA